VGQIGIVKMVTHHSLKFPLKLCLTIPHYTHNSGAFAHTVYTQYYTKTPTAGPLL
jgi:hypothetical protein